MTNTETPIPAKTQEPSNNTESKEAVLEQTSNTEVQVTEEAYVSPEHSQGESEPPATPELSQGESEAEAPATPEHSQGESETPATPEHSQSDTINSAPPDIPQNEDMIKKKQDEELGKASKKRDVAIRLRNTAQQKRNEAILIEPGTTTNNEESGKKTKRNFYWSFFKRNTEKKGVQNQDNNNQKKQSCLGSADNLEVLAQKLENEANEIEKNVFNNDEGLKNRYRAASDREKSAMNLVSKANQLNESTEKTLNELNDRDNTLEKICGYKEGVLSKQKKCVWSLVFLLLCLLIVVVLTILITGVTIGSFSIIISGKIRLLFAVVFLLLFVALLVYCIYSTGKRYIRYNNAINKMDVLKLRLELYTDKDLITPYRINREIEMIYKILES